MRGKLIVFEGGEGSGKTTQIQRLHHWLCECEPLKALQAAGKVAGVKLTREPGGTALGQQIRKTLLSPADVPIASHAELLLYAADRAQHVTETLMPWLEQGYWVLCDRYIDSTVAYQGYGRRLDFDLINQLNTISTGGLKTDLTFWLNVSPEVGLARMLQRGKADRMEQAGYQFHQRVADGFATLAKPVATGPLQGQPQPSSSGPTEEIDGDRPVDAIAAHIQQIFEQRLAQWYPPVSQL